jgi:PKD repeat protein
MDSINVTITNPCNLTATFETIYNGNGNYSFTSTTNSAGGETYSWNFGDGNSSTLANPTHNYTNSGTYAPYLAVTDSVDCTANFMDSINVTISNPCNLTATFETIDNGNGNFSFTSTTNSAGDETYSWNFGDGNSSTLANPTHNYTNSGTYAPYLTVTDSVNCTANYSDSINVAITNPCNLTATFETIDNGNGNFSFASTSNTGGSVTYNWNFGDGNSSTLANPTHNYTNSGTYAPYLTVTDSVNCTVNFTDTVSVTINTPCDLTTASFTTTDNGNGNFSFTSTTNNNGGDTYVWIFNDGDSSSVTNPNHTFINSGVYNVTLTVTDSGGCSATALQTVSVSIPCHSNTGFTSRDNGNGNFFFVADTTHFNGSETYAWSFGDGGTSNVSNPNHVFTNSGAYIVTFTVTDSSGCTDSEYYTVNVTIPCNLITSFTSTDNGNGNFSFIYAPANSAGGAVYNWNFGDDNSSTLANPSHTYAASGSYNPSLTVTDSANCTATFTDSISVAITNPCNLVVNFSSTDNGNGNFSFASTSNTGGSETYSWNFGDGNSSTLANPSHTYAASGSYNSSLTVTDSANCTATFTDSISVTIINPCNLVVNFSSTDNGNGNFSFASTSNTGGSVTYNWNFGDGNSSTLTNPTHTYSTSGSYNPSLTVTDSANCTANYSDSINVTITNPCNLTATFETIDNGNGNFSFTSTTNSAGGETYSWNFGDGNSSTLANPTHNYTNSGTYAPSLTVTDSVDCTANYSDTVFAVVTNPCNLTMSFTSTDNSNGYFSFSSSISSSGGGEVYNWNFGDGNSSNLPNPAHTYTNSGSYSPSLTVTDSANCTVSYSDSLNVNLANPCNYIVTANDSNGTDGYFYTNAWPNASNYLWDFGDGNTSTNPGPIHTYAAAGTYNYCVTIDNCAPICNTITIMDSNPCNVNSSFSVVDNGGGNFTFTNNSSGNISFTSWSFGDGAASSALNPTHTFLANGTYTIVLYSALVDSNYFGGCSDYATVTINVTGVVNPVPCQAGVAMYTNPLNSNQIIVVNSSIGNSLTYFWDFGDGNTSTLALPVHFYGGNGPYYLCVTVDDGNGCSSTYCDSIGSSGIVLKNGGFSLNTEAPSAVVTSVPTAPQTVLEFKVYPNPFKNNVTIELNLMEAALTTIFVTDLLGNNVTELNNSVLNAGDNKLTWKATNIANGVYLLNIKTASGLTVEKLILNR